MSPSDGEIEVASWHDANLDIHFPEIYLCQCASSGMEYEEEEEEEEPECWDSEDIYGLNRRMQFADPGGNSALRAASEDNPRNLPCPTCHAPNRLTPEDKRLGYQCDDCADQLERGGY